MGGHSPPRSDTAPLCVRPTTSPDGAARSIRTQLSQLMRQAGIGHIDGVTGMSIRYTAARRVFEDAGIEAAARFLGASKLDTTLELAGCQLFTGIRALAYYMRRNKLERLDEWFGHHKLPPNT